MLRKLGWCSGEFKLDDDDLEDLLGTVRYRMQIQPQHGHIVHRRSSTIKVLNNVHNCVGRHEFSFKMSAVVANGQQPLRSSMSSCIQMQCKQMKCALYLNFLGLAKIARSRNNHCQEFRKSSPALQFSANDLAEDDF